MRDEQRLDVWDEPITKEEMDSLEKYPNLKEALANLQGNILKETLANLQGNILRGHGRKRSANLFLRFQKGKQEAVSVGYRVRLSLVSR